MRVITLLREIDINTLEPVLQARLVFTMDDIPSTGEYAYRCRLIGEKILEALDEFKEKKVAKIRAGFVSNSSSSSFVVARAVVGDEMFSKIKALLEATKNSDDPEDEEYESETSFDSNKNYILANVSHHDDFSEKFDKLGLKTDQYLWSY